MSIEKQPKKKNIEDENGDPFWSRILIVTIVVVWISLVAGNWIGHFVIKSGILGKKSTAYGSEFKISPAIKAKDWKQPVKVITPTQEPITEVDKPAILDKQDDVKTVNDSGEKIEISPSPSSTTEVSPSPGPSPEPTKAAATPTPSPTPRRETPTPSPTKAVVKPSPSPKPSQAKATPRATQADTAGDYTLQVGNFEKNDNAVDLVNKLRDKGYSATIVKEGERFKVYVGNYNSKNKAGETSGKLKNDGFESFIISE